MKYLCSIILVVSLFLMSCSEKSNVIDPNYAAYQKAMQSQMDKEVKPLFDLTLDEQGRVKGIKMYAEQKIVHIQQYTAPVHPIWGVIKSAVPVIGTVLGIREGGKAIERIANSGGDSYTNSNNVDDNSVSNKDNSINTDDNSVNTDDNSINDAYNVDDNSSSTDSHSVNTDDNSVNN